MNYAHEDNEHFIVANEDNENRIMINTSVCCAISHRNKWRKMCANASDRSFIKFRQITKMDEARAM